MIENDPFEQAVYHTLNSRSTLVLEKPPDEIKSRLDVVRRLLTQNPPEEAGDQLFVQTGKPGYWFPLNASITMGTGAENMVRLNSEFVSKIHCTISKVNGGWVLKDLHSANGVYVNNKKVSEYFLKYGDIIQIADQKLVFINKLSLTIEVD